MLGLLVFALGASVGSFLNVVADRLPARPIDHQAQVPLRVVPASPRLLGADTCRKLPLAQRKLPHMWVGRTGSALGDRGHRRSAVYRRISQVRF